MEGRPGGVAAAVGRWVVAVSLLGAMEGRPGGVAVAVGRWVVAVSLLVAMEGRPGIEPSDLG
jgi:hypothetical protein